MVDRDAWQDEWREEWDVINGLLRQIRDNQGGAVSALEDLQAAVAGNQEVASRVADLVDSLQDQVTALQAQIQALIDAGNADLQPLIDTVNAISADLTAAEAPNEPAEG